MEILQPCRVMEISKSQNGRKRPWKSITLEHFCSFLFFLENNSLPFDHLLRGEVEEYCALHNYDTEEAKTIYYKNKKDFVAYQTFKIICNRSFSGRKADLTRPNLDHCGSQDFCMESFLEQ